MKQTTTYSTGEQHKRSIAKSILALTLPPLYHRKAEIFVWLFISALLACTFFAVSVIFMDQHDVHTHPPIRILFLGCSIAIFLVWQKNFLCPSTLFSMWRFGVSTATLLIAQTLSSCLLAILLLILPWSIIVHQQIGYPQQQWWQIPLMGLLILLSSHSVASWFWVWSKFFSSQLAYAALACLSIALFIFSGALFAVDGSLIWVQLALQGGAALTLNASLETVFTFAVGHYVIALVALWLTLNHDRIGLNN